jgi:hypothetical protein
MKIEEVKIPFANGPIFIDYSKIGNSPKRRIFFLRALVRLADTKESYFHYEDLGISEKEIEFFKRYLEENHPGRFRLYKKTINPDPFKGKIICDTDLLLKDIFSIFPMGDGDVDQKMSESVKKESTKNHEFIETPRMFDELPTNKYMRELFYDGVAPAEIQLFITDIFKNLKEEEIKKLFTLLIIKNEIDKLPKRVFNKENGLNLERLFAKRENLEKVLQSFNEKFSNSDYWKIVKFQTDEAFKKIIEKCDLNTLEIVTKDGVKKNITVNELLLNEDIKIVFAESGNSNLNNRNPVISRFQGIIVVFDFKSKLSNEILPGQFVLSEVYESASNPIVVRPLKILTKEETLKLMAMDVACYPTRDLIQKNLD